MKRILFPILLFLGAVSLNAQQTVGLFSIDNGANEGYNLFAPMPSQTTYLMDNCGQVVHSWSSSNRPGLSVYLLEDGTLLRTGNLNNQLFSAGGSGGMVEMLDWNSNQTWEYEYSSGTYCQHHDVEILPNGNVLIIAWELKAEAEGLAQGRDPSNLTSDGVWPDKIIEVQATGATTGTIVWEWHAWDHLVQDYDNNQTNFGVVSDHPELIDINYPSPAGPQMGGNTDWLHINGVDYNEGFDQIILSIHNTSEFWVIDHSTTTAEAIGHTGGNSGKGGDLLYRWGNPQAYGRGTVNDQQLYAQHDARWIADTLPWPGMIMVYNNGNNSRPNSSVEIVNPPVDAMGNYSITTGQAYGPAAPTWSYDGGTTNSWYTSSISGAHPLPNGNVLICEGTAGRFFEVDSTGGMHWEYVSPVTNSGVVNQEDPISGNSVFRVHRYSANYPGLAGQSLTPGDRIERNPYALPAICTATSLIDEQEITLTAYPNPFAEEFWIRLEGVTRIEMEAFDMMGRQILPLTMVTRSILRHGLQVSIS